MLGSYQPVHPKEHYYSGPEPYRSSQPIPIPNAERALHHRRFDEDLVPTMPDARRIGFVATWMDQYKTSPYREEIRKHLVISGKMHSLESIWTILFLAIQCKMGDKRASLVNAHILSSEEFNMNEVFSSLRVRLLEKLLLLVNSKDLDLSHVYQGPYNHEILLWSNKLGVDNRAWRLSNGMKHDLYIHRSQVPR